jgi:hypothetical protein
VEQHEHTDHFDEFDGVNSPEEDYSNDQQHEDDLFTTFDSVEDYEEDFEESDEDSTELERRRTRYAELKKDDKIFNNTYNMGYETSEDDENETSGSSIKEIKVDASSPDYFMYDQEKYSEYVDQGIIQREIFGFIQGNAQLNEILGSEPEKKKFVKQEINQMFEILCHNLITTNNRNYFITPIYVLDAMSVTISTDYKKIFDMLSYENKETLLLELNSKYGFLDKLTKSNKMF